MVKECLARFKRMFENSNDEWVARLDVEYTTVLGSEKKLKEAERKKPAVEELLKFLALNVGMAYVVDQA